MYISGTEPSSVIYSQTEYFKKLRSDDAQKSTETTLSQKGWCNKPKQLQFQSILTQTIFILSKRYQEQLWCHG